MNNNNTYYPRNRGRKIAKTSKRLLWKQLKKVRRELFNEEKDIKIKYGKRWI